MTENTEQETFTSCESGHVYDESQINECPHCAAAEEIGEKIAEHSREMQRRVRVAMSPSGSFVNTYGEMEETDDE